MYGHIAPQLAIEKTDEAMRMAGDRRRSAIHERQRSLVLASLLFSRVRDVPTHRRTVRGEV